MTTRKFAQFLAIGLAVFASIAIAMADQTQIAGFTTGGFPTTNTWQRLTYTGLNFGPVLPNAFGKATINNIGKFDLGVCGNWICGDSYWANDKFKLTVNITDPTNQNASFIADMTGTVGRFANSPFGDLDIFFDNWSNVFTYNNTSGPDAGTGKFTFSLIGNDLFLGHLHLDANRGTTYLGAQIIDATFTPVPEPAAIMLFGSLVLGLGVWRKVTA